MRPFVILGFTFLTCLVEPVLAEDLGTTRLPAQILVEGLQGSFAAAGSQEVRKISPIGLKLLQVFETFADKPTDDASNFCSIGYGHIIALQSCETLSLGKFANGISREEGAALLEADSRYATSAVESLTQRYLNDDQFSAVATFVFSVGREKFSSSKLLALLNQGDLPGASAEFRNWTRISGKILPQLVKRRKCEELLYLSELKLGDENALIPKTCD